MATNKLNKHDTEQIIPDYDFLFDENSTNPNIKKSKLLGKLFKINIKPIIISLLLYIIQSSPLWVTPLLTSDIINIATRAITAGAITNEHWIALGIDVGIITICLLQNVPITMLRLRITDKMLRTTSAGIKTSVIKKLQSLSITYHKDIESGKIQSKFIKDTDAVEGLFRQIIANLLPNIITTIIAIVISIYKNGYVALFFLLVIPCNVWLSMLFRKKIGEKNKDYRIKSENMSAKLTNMLSMMQVTKSHGLEDTEISSVKDSIYSVTGSGLKLDRTVAKFGSMVFVVNNILSALCLVFCTILALYHYIEIGDIVLFTSMFSSISGHIMNLISLFPQIGSGMEALNSVSEIMSATDVEVNTGKYVVPDIDGNIELKNVTYHYPNSNKNVISNFSLKVDKGECIAVVGSSGSGKSTLMNMVIGFLFPTKGELLIDDKNITEINLSEYRHHISVVPQNSILFKGSIRDNITYGLVKYNEEDLQKVVEMANLNEFLTTLPNGLDTEIGEHGDKLSGGQKQRITIARALIRNPKILILDEATSALDNISEYHVQQAIEKSIKGRTTFIVAHRLSTIRNADRIVVMEEGKCVETGTYAELMELKGKFYELKNLNDLNLKIAEENLK